MGYAARANACSFDAGKGREDVGIARMLRYAAAIKTPRQLESWLSNFLPEDRERVRVAIRPDVTFDPGEIEREDAALNESIRRQAAYGPRPIYNRPID